jgi:hypothetical protein
MEPSILEVTPHEGFDTAPLGRAGQIALYRQRLERLLRIDAPAAAAGLTEAEVNRLRGMGVLASIRALTALEAGALASEVLRRAPRRAALTERD